MHIIADTQVNIINHVVNILEQLNLNLLRGESVDNNREILDALELLSIGFQKEIGTGLVH